MESTTSPQPETRDDSFSVLALVAFIIGLLSLCAWLLPLCGAPLTVMGLILALLARRSPYPHVVLAAVVLCLLGLAATIISAALGLQAALSGQYLPF